jgi:adenine-specific DNA-methyltransferase
MTTYGPHNPHPLSRMKTELVWEGKYDEFGNRREVNVGNLSMPLQKIETIDEPRSRADEQGSLFDPTKAHRDDFRNRLIWGDNKLVMASLLEEFAGKIDLIYIDPPFDVGADFTMDVAIGDGSQVTEKDQSLIEMVAYRDMWGRGADSYLQMLSERLLLMKALLSSTGSIFVHCDWHMSHMIRMLLESVFGRDHFVNEIVWHYYNKMQGNVGHFPKNHDTLFWYRNGDSFKYHAQREDRQETTKQIKRVWDKEKGKIVNAKGPDGKVIYIDSESRGVDSVWYLSMLQPADKTENLGYATQKPEALVGRIVSTASDDGDLVADFFSGSGTTLAVAEQLGRRWIGADLGRYSIHTSRKRLITLQRELHERKKPYRSFDLYNLGRYERQWWQKEALKGADDEHRAVVLKFFRAEPLTKTPSPLLHARKGNAFVHVDGIDSIFTRAEIKEVAQATAAAGGREVYVLAWDFEMDIRQVATAVEAETGVKLRLSRIPREIMEKNRTEVPPFFEVALLHAEPVIRKSGKDRKADIKLTNFLPSLSEVPSKELEVLQDRAVESGFDFIDFWAIDFDWRPNRPFNHNWQDFRTRKDRTLKTVSDAEHVYHKSGKYVACIKVVDVFGCDTSITLEIEV